MLTITSPASWPLGLPTSPPEIGSWAREGAWWTPQREPLWGGAAVTLSERIEQLREPRARVWAPHPPALGPGAAHASCPRRAGRGRGQPGVDPGPPPGADALHRADTLAGSSPAPGLSSPCPRSPGVALPVAPGAPPTLLPRPLLPPTFHLRAGWAAPLTTSAQACGHRFQSLVPTQATLPLGFLRCPYSGASPGHQPHCLLPPSLPPPASKAFTTCAVVRPRARPRTRAATPRLPNHPRLVQPPACKPDRATPAQRLHPPVSPSGPPPTHLQPRSPGSSLVSCNCRPAAAQGSRATARPNCLGLFSHRLRVALPLPQQLGATFQRPRWPRGPSAPSPAPFAQRGWSPGAPVSTL